MQQKHRYDNIEKKILHTYKGRKVVILITTVTLISIKMFGAMHFIYYINKSIAMKVDSTYRSSRQEMWHTLPFTILSLRLEQNLRSMMNVQLFFMLKCNKRHS